MTLKLKRLFKGYYENQAGDIKVNLNNPFVFLGEGSNAWQLTIEIGDEELVSEYFQTKKEASEFGAKIINSL